MAAGLTFAYLIYSLRLSCINPLKILCSDFYSICMLTNILWYDHTMMDQSYLAGIILNKGILNLENEVSNMALNFTWNPTCMCVGGWWVWVGVGVGVGVGVCACKCIILKCITCQNRIINVTHNIMCRLVTF
jgi:hypothetical protein